MQSIHIASNILKERKARGVTQAQLAEHMGVSKAAVSKWEAGQSFPDLTLLPRLASYLGQSIDALIGYAPQLSKAEIQALYRALAADFAQKPFAETLARCLSTARQYYACFPLLFSMASLLMNHAPMAGDAAQMEPVLLEAITLLRRIKSESEDMELCRQALHAEVYCLLVLNRPEEALAMLKDLPPTTVATETVLAAAYQMTGRSEKAQETLQIGVYQDLLRMMEMLGQSLHLYLDQPERFAETYRRGVRIADSFALHTLHPAVMMSFYILAAQGFCAMGHKEGAYQALEAYIRLVRGDIFPLRLTGDDFFDRLAPWLEEINVYPPRDEALVRQSIVEAVTGSPAFAPLAHESRFQDLCRRLSMLLTKEESAR